MLLIQLYPKAILVVVMSMQWYLKTGLVTVMSMQWYLKTGLVTVMSLQWYQKSSSSDVHAMIQKVSSSSDIHAMVLGVGINRNDSYPNIPECSTRSSEDHALTPEYRTGSIDVLVIVAEE